MQDSWKCMTDFLEMGFPIKFVLVLCLFVFLSMDLWFEIDV